MYPTPRILRTPDLSQPQTAFPTYAPTPPEQVGLAVLQGVLQEVHTAEASQGRPVVPQCRRWCSCSEEDREWGSCSYGSTHQWRCAPLQQMLVCCSVDTARRCKHGFSLQGGVQEFLAARLHNVFGQNLDMGELVRRSRAAVLDTVEVRPLLLSKAYESFSPAHAVDYQSARAPCTPSDMHTVVPALPAACKLTVSIPCASRQHCALIQTWTSAS